MGSYKSRHHIGRGRHYGRSRCPAVANAQIARGFRGFSSRCRRLHSPFPVGLSLFSLPSKELCPLFLRNTIFHERPWSSVGRGILRKTKRSENGGANVSPLVTLANDDRPHVLSRHDERPSILAMQESTHEWSSTPFKHNPWDQKSGSQPLRGALLHASLTTVSTIPPPLPSPVPVPSDVLEPLTSFERSVGGGASRGETDDDWVGGGGMASSAPLLGSAPSLKKSVR